MNPSLTRFATLSLVSLELGRAVPALAADGATQGSPAEDNVRVRALYRESATLFKAGRSAAARQRLLEAWSIRQTYDVATSLAQVELELGLDRDAAEHLDFAIRHFAPIESEETLEQAQDAFRVVKGRVASARVSVDRDGATLLVDGAPSGTSPLASPVFLSPGPHTVAARLGAQTVSKTVLAEAGREDPIELRLGVATLAPAPLLRDAPPASEPPAPSVLPLVVGGAAFTVGAAVGIGFGLAAAARDDDAKALRAAVGPSGCSTGGAAIADCAALHDAADGRDRDRSVATAGFVLAGAALVATPLYWLLSAPPGERRTGSPWRSVRIAGAAVPRAAAVTLSGSF